MGAVDEVCCLLETHANRDKVVSLASYTLKLWGATSKNQPLITASARITAARATLRLFDDAAAIRALLKYGLGRQDGLLWGGLGVSNGVLQLSYLQCEKLVWLLDTGVLTLSPELDEKIRIAHKLFWSLSAFVALVRTEEKIGIMLYRLNQSSVKRETFFHRSLRALHLTAQIMKSPNRPKCTGVRFTQASLTTSKLLLDVLHAVSWLPRGWLWGGALSTTQVSTLATVSAVFGLVMHYNGKRLLPR
ncbi:Peroxisomal membrane protein 11C [Papilio xuthus]|uniref:Peroxisomal membrane protein 11C n=1 Tax=Papilio xuthus TaxID=66420 RepID=A0A194Q1N5_PAPXU|nr:Peroxisomal membrane protein 11C [Papilio xuthus]